MSTTAQVEPTEEQREAAARFYYREEGDLRPLVSDVGLWVKTGRIGGGAIDDACISLARLLAEREAKLREEVTRLEALCTEEARLIVERDTLRARVAKMQEELEGERSLSEQLFSTNGTLRARVAELEAKIADAVFSCPGCGRHDFGFFASQIKAACGPCRTRAEAAEAREDALTARVAELEAEVSESTRLRMTETLHGMGVEAMHQEREAQHLADSVCWLTGVKP